MRPSRFSRISHGDQAGLTLVELLVASAMSLVVLGGAVQLLTGVSQHEPQAQSQAAGVQQARFTIDRLTRELRQGSTVSTATASQLSILTYVDQTTCGGSTSTTARLCQVTYTCSGAACTRAVSDPGTSASGGAEVVSGLSSSTVFSYSPSTAAPTFVGVTLAFPARSGSNAITLSDGVALRNSGATG